LTTADREHVIIPISETFEGWTMDVDELIPAQANRVVATGRYLGTHRPSGRQVSAQFCIIYTVADDMIVEGHQYVDTARIREVMVSSERRCSGSSRPAPTTSPLGRRTR
jgi:ketosteroid isomerase-like protein